MESTSPYFPQTHRHTASTQEETEPGRSCDLLGVTHRLLSGAESGCRLGTADTHAPGVLLFMPHYVTNPAEDVVTVNTNPQILGRHGRYVIGSRINYRGSK